MDKFFSKPVDLMNAIKPDSTKDKKSCFEVSIDDNYILLHKIFAKRISSHQESSKEDNDNVDSFDMKDDVH